MFTNISVKRLHIVTQYKRDFKKLTTFSVARANVNQTKLITNSESTIKIKARSPWELFLNLRTLAVTYKQRFLHRNETVQYLENYKRYHLNQCHYRKAL